MSEKIYIDTCALNRIADDHSQPRVRQEAEAMVGILDLVAAGRLFWSASTVLHFEIQRTPDPIRRINMLKLLSNAAETVSPTLKTLQRALDLASNGLAYLDSLHLAMAEQQDADSFISTDDRLLKQVRARLQITRPEVVNPVEWIERRHPWLLPKAPSSAT
jgi:predicted nucleic acid-binding protein